MEVVIKCTGTDKIALCELSEFQCNIKKLNSKNKQKLKKSIIEKGFIAPIFVWDSNGEKKILDGHQRVKVLNELHDEGYSIPKLPIIYVVANNEEDAKSKLLSITSQYGEFQISELKEWCEFEVEDTIRLVDTEIIINDEIDDRPEQEIKKTEIKKVVKYGDIWKLDNGIMLKCSNWEYENEYELIVYDPPFEIDMVYDSIPQYADGKKMIVFWDMIRCGEANWQAINKGWKFNYELILDCVTSWYVPGRPLERHKGVGVYGELKYNFEKAIYDDGKTREDVKAKNERGEYICKALPSGKHLSSVESINNAQQEKHYKYEKPLEWVKAIIEGIEIKGRIYDPYAGSATTAIIAHQLNLDWIGYENNPEIADIALNKWYNITGKNPINQNGEKYI